MDEKRLRLALGLVFLALAVPTGILIDQTYRRLKWEAFHHQQAAAEELAGRIDGRLAGLIASEERRSFADYAFLVVAGDPSASFLQRSPLSAYPVASDIPGLIGHFQVDTRGMLSSPLLPNPGVDASEYGVTAAELGSRLALQQRIEQILSENRLVRPQPAVTDSVAAAPAPRQRSGGEPSTGAEADGDRPPVARRDLAASSSAETPAMDRAALERAGKGPVMAQAAFDRLNEAVGLREKKQRPAGGALGRVEDLKLEPVFRAKVSDEPQPVPAPAETAVLERRSARKEQTALPRGSALLAEDEGPGGEPAAEAPGHRKPRIDTFESEIDPFELSLLGSGHFVLFRKVWRDGQRYIQGALLEQRPFLEGTIEAPFREATLSRVSDLAVAHRGDVLAAFSGQGYRQILSSAEDLRGALLYQTRLSAPLSALQLIFSVHRMPPAPGAAVVGWVAGLLLLTLCGGFYLLYRLGLSQIRLARQQQDFVSAVSHELKTPLTSIRMYSEMLREGWVTEDKRASYYQFIHDESERLSRLITNVLQLARMTRNELRVDLRPFTLAELLGGALPKIASQAERAGVALNLECGDEAGQVRVRADADFLAQILINLVDNAIKFSVSAENKAIDVACRPEGRGVLVSVRDYGPGVPRDQLRKIFRLFYRYRSQSELTRETPGTGIGLALVRELTLAMGGTIDVVNRDPGAEFRLYLPAAQPDP